MESKEFKEFWESQTTPLHAHAQEKWFDRYASEIRNYLPQQGIIVDAGCGSGEILLRLLPQYKKIVGIDYSQSMLDQTRMKVGNSAFVELHCGSITQIKSYCAEEVDAIYCNGVIQYLSKEELLKFVKDSLDVLSPSGSLLLLQIPNINCRTLFRLGFYRHESKVPFSSILKGMISLFAKDLINLIKGRKSDDGIGNWYSMEEMKQLAASLGATAEVYGSAFVNYYYRFHVVITKN